MLFAEAGFSAELFEDTSEAHLRATPTPSVPGQLTLAVFVDDLGQKAGNARCSFQEGQL